jgi:molecular chaperone DnaK
MYLGIDLGTSNSAIVGYDAGKWRLFKTAEGLDVLPSVIMIDRRGSMLVGKRAYDQAAYSPENVAQGFKRLMGTSSTIVFGATGRTMTPEEASSEVMKALIAQAKMDAGEFKIEGAVITIPAAFNQMQTEATMRAAKAAGLAKVALLQEPIAAAMASIAKSDNKSGQFLVYDLGGGTFDVAIVQSIAGSATVVAHAGINMLGGRDFDRAILNSIVRPWLLKNFDLPDNFQTDNVYQRLLRVAQHHCEVAKIVLSTKLADRIFTDENQINAKDRQGKEIYLDVEITREALEALIKDDIARSVELCRSLLKDAGYRPEDIDRVVMVGGPSRMPIVRNSVSDHLGIRVDTDTDPMTAVAMGAAIYSEGRDWNDTVVGAKSSRGSRKPKGPLDIRYDFPARTADDHVRIRVRSGSGIEKKGYRLVVDTEDGWTSGQIALEDSMEIKDVPLGKRGENVIRITVFDAKGAPMADAISELSIFRALATAAGMPITHTIAVKIVKYAAGIERNILVPLVKKGTSLPTSGMEKFRAARDLRANDDGTSLDFELFEQTEGVDDPELNLPIGVFRVSSTDLGRGDVIRKGDDIFVHWAIDGNGLLDPELEIPAISKRYSTGRMYVSTRDHRNFDGEDGISLAAEVINSAESDINRLDKALGSKVANAISDLQDRLARQREALRLAHEADTRRAVSEEGRFIRQEVARIRNSPENIKSSLRSEIDEFVEGFSVDFASSSDPKINSQVHRLAGLARDALMKDDRNSIEDARRSLDEMRAIVLSDLAKRPGFWVGMFEDLAKDRHRAIDKSKHDQLVNEGEALIRKEDIDGLRQVTFQLRDNMVRSADASSPDVLAGLMR